MMGAYSSVVRAMPIVIACCVALVVIYAPIYVIAWLLQQHLKISPAYSLQFITLVLALVISEATQAMNITVGRHTIDYLEVYAALLSGVTFPILLALTL